MRRSIFKKIINKSLNVFSALILVTIVSISLLAFYRYLQNEPQVFPYSYQFKYHLSKEELDLASSADVLILGDIRAEFLDQFLSSTLLELSSRFEKKIKMFNWSSKREPLHLSLYKLKALHKVPPVVIYHGGENEYLLPRVNPDDLHFFYNNLKTFRNKKIQSLILLFPNLSRFFFTPYQKLVLSERSASYSPYLEAEKKQQIIEVTHIMHKQESIEFTNYLNKNKSHGVLISSAINLLAEPKENCSQTTSVDIEKTLKNYELQILSGNEKLILSKLELLNEKLIANAQSHYLLGKIYYQLGQFSKAKSFLHKAKSFDCSLTQTDALYNLFLLESFSSQNNTIIDLHKITQEDFHLWNPFESNGFPKEKYYQSVSKLIEKTLKEHLVSKGNQDD